jgi:hypothetical protein
MADGFFVFEPLPPGNHELQLSTSVSNPVEPQYNYAAEELYNLIVGSSAQNQTAHKIIYTNTNKNPNFPLTFKSMQIFALKDGQAYTISYVSEESQYPGHLPIIERMIDSISFSNR